MKTKLFLFSFIILLVFVFSSISFETSLINNCYYISFDDTEYKQCLIIDTSSNSNKLWQVGHPGKTVMVNAKSYPNVIITDTINPYLINDTSSFYITFILDSWGIMTYFSGNYWVNSDTLSDYGKIEVSFDHGNNWIDVINDTAYFSYLNWSTPKPVLTGNSYGWKYFDMDPSSLFSLFNTSPGDTVFYRMSFVSDSVQTNKDGLMFDDFSNGSIVEGIDESAYKRFHSKSYSSAGDLIIIISDLQSIQYSLFLFDNRGKKILEKVITPPRGQMNINELPNGVYYYELLNTKEKRYSAGKFFKQN